MKKILSLGLATLTLLLSGCQLMHVNRAHVPVVPNAPEKTDSVPGMPFYIKKAACLHSVVWFEPVYTLTLELTTTPAGANAKPTTAQLGSVVLSLTQLKAKPAQDLFHAMNGDSPTVQDVMKAWLPVATQDGTPYTPTNFPDATNRILIANTSEPQLYVDYSQPYYVNVTRPLAGSAKIDSKLASDGTLTEVSAEVEDKTIETIATGIKDLVTAVGTAAKGVDADKTVQRLKLSVTVGGFKHTLSKLDTGATMPCAAAGEDVAAPYKYSRSEVTSPAAEKKDDTKKSKISVSGEIVLPDTKPADDTEKPKAPAATAAPAAPKKDK
jgi:hypothetical protein